jgi:7-cyano-7-deazaguanine synthase in queuosine biosynthesis
VTVPTTIVVCNGASARRENSATPLELRSFGGAANVRLKLGQIGAAMLTHPPVAFLDLIEIATFVYIADQQVHRGAHDVDTFGGNWRRSFRFHIPVRVPELWSSDPVRSSLLSLLTFLSDDDYEFEFSPLRSPPELPNYLDFNPDADRPEPSEVILFSGGLDSLGGVVERVIEQGHSAILVTHESTAKLRKRHRILREMIEARTRGPLPQHLSVTVNKQGQEEREYTQRSRSFLYASLAAATARMIGQDKVTFFENGIVSMNLPLAAQVVGSKSTRTTHPIVLGRMAKLFSLLDDTPFSVSNGFLWKTKTDVVELIKGANHADLIPWSTSCMHTWQFRNEHPHCGNCSQCVDRRFAVLAGAGEECESAASYARDVLTGERDDDESRMLVASYTERAVSLSRMSESEFLSKNGVVARLIRHVGLPEPEALTRIHALHQRHGQQVAGVLAKAIGSHGREIIDDSLPRTSLLRLSIDTGLASPALPTSVGHNTATSHAPKYAFIQNGDGWEVHFDGAKFYLNDHIGPRYLACILRRPGRPITVSELNLAVSRKARYVPEVRSEALSTNKDVQLLIDEIRNTSELLAQAEKSQDLTQIDVHRRRRDELTRSLQMSGFKGKPRKESSAHKKTRDRVLKAIKDALGRMDKYCKPARRHFDIFLVQGTSLLYSPPTGMEWEFLDAT